MSATIRRGHEVEVSTHSTCDFCDRPATYDGRTSFGPWAFMCDRHFSRYGVGTGLGNGQRLIVAGEDGD